MTSNQFDRLLKRRIEKILGVLANKAKEYSSNSERLHNFYRASAISGRNPETALYGMMLKHLVSVLDILDASEKGSLPDRPVVDEKIGDLINYLILLEAVFEDRRNQLNASAKAQ